MLQEYKNTLLTVLILLAVIPVTLLLLQEQQQVRQFAATTVYYVDCNGNDAADGLSEQTAWKTVSKANTATLQPGDKLFFKRDCTWNGSLIAKWIGTANNPIIIGAYGTGDRPLIEFDANDSVKSRTNVQITGSYQIVENMRATMINPFRDTSCLLPNGQGVPLGFYVGFSISGNNNTLRSSEAFNMAVGIFTTDTSSFNKIINNDIHDLNVLWRLDPVNGALGALGINLHGNDNEYALNMLRRNAAECTLTSDGSAQSYSAPFEVYNANRNFVHHNQAYSHRKHFEMGHDPGKTTDDNILAYNLFVSDKERATGPNIHSVTNQFGPIKRTKILNNTIVFAGLQSQGIVCGCDDDDPTGTTIIKNNIFVAVEKAGFFGGDFEESHNIFWKIGGNPFVQFGANATPNQLHSTSRKTDPQLVNEAVPSGDYHVSPSSPAINTGTDITSLVANLTSDLDQVVIPQGGIPDIGAYEFTTSTPTPTPTLSPMPSNLGNGDANNDGTVNSLDLQIVLQNWSVLLNNAVDQFKDGRINALDFVRVLQQLP